MAWYASVAKVGHSTRGLTTTITFRVTQRVDGNSYDAVGWDVRWSSSTGASGPLRFAINKNQTVTRDFSVSVGHNSSTGIAPNVTVTVSNLREGNYISNVVSKSASFQPPKVNVTKVPPQVSNVKLTRNSDSQLTINWTNNGSGNTAPNHNYVDIKTDDGSWVCIHNGGTKTSHVWTGASKGHKYQARVNSGNSAGHNTHVESNIVYTAPESLKKFSDGRVIVIDTNQNLSVNFDSSNVKYTSNKIEMQYSNDNSVWRGINGTMDSVYTFNNAVGSSLSLTDKEMDSTLKSYISALDDSGKLYLRARIYNTDNSLTSSWSDSTLVKLSKQPMVKFYLPDDKIYYTYTAQILMPERSYIAKIPKHLLDNGKKLSGGAILAFFGFSQIKYVGSGEGCGAIPISANVYYLKDIIHSREYTKADLDAINWYFSVGDFSNLESYDFGQHLKDIYTDPTAPSTARISINNNDANILHFANSSHTLTLPADMSAVSFSKGKEELGYYYLLFRYGDSEIQRLIRHVISSTREGLRYYAPPMIQNELAIQVPTLVQGKIYKNNELPLQIDKYVTTISEEPFRGSGQTFKLHPLSIQIKI